MVAWRDFTGATWRTIRQPTYQTGMLVIHSDDGRTGDWSHWYPLCVELSRKYSEWSTRNVVKFCPAINSGTLNTAERITTAQLQTLATWTEILNHGKCHAALGRWALLAQANAGQKDVYSRDVNQVNPYGVAPGYKYLLVDGATSEEVEIDSISADHLTMKANLQNTYTTNGYIQLTQASALNDIQDCIADLDALGITVQHYVYPSHAGSQYNANPAAETWVAVNNLSGRGTLLTEGAINTPSNDLHNLKCMSATLTAEQIDTLLDEVVTSDGVLIWYGHGETGASTLTFLTRLAETALSKGIRIGTMTQAVAKLMA